MTDVISRNGNNGNTESPINIGDDGTVTIGARSLIYVGETTETVDSVSYTVKNYADVYVEDPYFYTYFKLYYLNNKLRRLHVYYHGFECERDYKYTEFVEHNCIPINYYGDLCKKYSYYENGKIESIYREYVENGKIGWDEVKFYLNGNCMYEKNFTVEHEHTYQSETFYFANGKIKHNLNIDDNNLSDFTEYYESGYCRYYYGGGYLYTYEDGKVKKTSSNENDYSSKTAYTPEQALAKLEELKSQ